MRNIINEALAINEDKRMLQGELELIWNYINEKYKGGNTLEIGAYKGMTSFLFGAAMDEYEKKGKRDGKHYIVDIFEDYETEDTSWGYEAHPRSLLLKNVGDYANYMDVIQSRSLGWDSISVIFEHKYDLVWIDGDHRYQTLLLELLMSDMVTDHIIGHDYGHDGVTRAVDTFCEKRGYTHKMWREGEYGLFEIIK